MADEDVSESFSEWQQIPSPSSPTLNNNDTQFSKEDLPINDATEITTLPLTDGNDEKGEGNKWLIKKNLRELSSWIVQITSNIRNYVGCKVGIVTFSSNRSRILAVLLVSLFYWMIQKNWRRQRQIDTSNKLMLLIKEKKQKIDQLSLQISQMNEFLLTRRNVPVLRHESLPIWIEMGRLRLQSSIKAIEEEPEDCETTSSTETAIACMVNSEVSAVLAVMRRNVRWGGRYVSRDDQLEHSLIQSLKTLRKQIFLWQHQWQTISPALYLQPFLDVIRSDETGAPITGFCFQDLDS
ncbi:hypothetical protein K7X08_031507 [Anisodus acutangulus]|uniref:Uncharacterized protein n=1 Tax=Anisodus acutangulus TaxID=402998 RepID=A0A9Q1ML74_9SOLA|nr:hypothetical protein K7X08_031507 [Anisodus acutangulus]